uniref:Uncharacterized protein n=1 Tax=Opuntia streptacantha TaxID=393608 RepID=A0A7C8Z3E5_OPUST
MSITHKAIESRSASPNSSTLSMDGSQVSAQGGPLNKALSPERTFVNRIWLQMSGIIPQNLSILASTNNKLIPCFCISKPMLQIFPRSIWLCLWWGPFIWHFHKLLNVIKHINSKYMGLVQFISMRLVSCKLSFLRGIILDETITKSPFSGRISGHPKTILFNHTDLAINLANNSFKLLKLLLWHLRQIVHYHNIPKPLVKFQGFLLQKIIVITYNSEIFARRQSNGVPINLAQIDAKTSCCCLDIHRHGCYGEGRENERYSGAMVSRVYTL